MCTDSLKAKVSQVATDCQTVCCVLVSPFLTRSRVAYTDLCYIYIGTGYLRLRLNTSATGAPPELELGSTASLEAEGLSAM
jgi:hypothetical protein